MKWAFFRELPWEKSSSIGVRKVLKIINPFVAFWVIHESSVPPVSQFFVESGRLKAERVESNAKASAIRGDLFGLFHQRRTDTALSEDVRHDQKIDEEPIIV